VRQIPHHPRILVIVLRRLGDVLLTTPLLRALRRGLEPACLDVLTFSGTEGMLAGNPDVSAVITVPQHPSWREMGALARRLRRSYDLAVSTQAGDRPTLFAWLAGRERLGLVPASGSSAWWKRKVLHRAVAGDGENHRVPELMRLVQALGPPERPDLRATPELVCPAPAPLPPAFLSDRPYAVLHANPMFRFRRWTQQGWHALAQALAERGLTVVATGGPDPQERAYLDDLWGADPKVVRADGQLSWQQLTTLLRGAAVYVGPDTSMTHLAAAAGCPTVALYGPASPHRIGPWPVGGLAEMWRPAGHIQHRGNVWVVQNPLPCLPCERLGCEGHLQSFSRCLDELAPGAVLMAVDQALGIRSRGAAPLSA
jgi:heptosyltransferase-3